MPDAQNIQTAENDLMNLAAKADEKEGELREAMFAGEYSEELVADLIAAVNAVLPLFKQPPLTDTTITPAVIKALQMIRDAASDAGLEAYNMSPRDDGELEMVIAALTNLANDGDFKRFLMSQPAQRPATGEEEGVGPAAAKRAASESMGAESPDMMSLLMSRAGPQAVPKEAFGKRRRM